MTNFTKKGDNVTKSELNTICQKTYEYKTKNGAYPTYTTFKNIQILKEELYDALIREGNYNASHTTPATEIRVGDVIATPTPVSTEPDESGLIKYCPTEVLERGSHDYCVGFLQKKLKQCGFYSFIVDNDFGDETYKSVVAFQNATGHTPDGIVGPKTWPDVLNYVPTVTPTPTGEFAEYLVATANCQVKDPTIQSIAKQIGNGAQGVFDWVLGLEYDYYYSTQRGALKTIQDGIGNCTDLTHAQVALARAKGIPARYVHCTAVAFSKITCGHVWGELYVNGEWKKADDSNNGNKFGVNPLDSQIVKGSITTRYAELPF